MTWGTIFGMLATFPAILAFQQQQTTRQHLLNPKDSASRPDIQCRRRLTLEINIVTLPDSPQLRSVSTTANACITQCVTVLSNGQILYGHRHGPLEELSPLLQTLCPNVWIIQVHNKSYFFPNRTREYRLTSIQQLIRTVGRQRSMPTKSIAHSNPRQHKVPITMAPLK